MEHIELGSTDMTERDREMFTKLERIKEDPETYFARARKLALREEARRALMPWLKYRTT